MIKITYRGLNRGQGSLCNNCVVLCSGQWRACVTLPGVRLQLLRLLFVLQHPPRLSKWALPGPLPSCLCLRDGRCRCVHRGPHQTPEQRWANCQHRHPNWPSTPLQRVTPWQPGCHGNQQDRRRDSAVKRHGHTRERWRSEGGGRGLGKGADEYKGAVIRRTGHGETFA